MQSKTQYVKDLKEKDTVGSLFLIKYSAVGTDKNGKSFMNLVLADRTGDVEARIWEDVPRYSNQAVRDSLVFVEGRCQSFQNRKQVVITRLSVVREDEVQIRDFLPEPKVDAELQYQKLKEFIASMKDPYYKALAESVLIDDAETVERLKRAPAAKSVHHAYPGGLVEHVVSVTGILDGLATHYKGLVDRDLLLLGGFFHDICKLWEMSYDRLTDYTMEGRLIGHLVMGSELVEKKVLELEKQADRLPGPFPLEKKLLIKHVILAHHGSLEYGSPKLPHVLEAVIVHAVDDLDSKVNSISEFMAADQTPGPWTALSRQYNRYFYRIQGENSKVQGSS